MRESKDNPAYKHFVGLIKDAAQEAVERLVGFNGEVIDGSIWIEFNFDAGGGRRICRAVVVPLPAINEDLFDK